MPEFTKQTENPRSANDVNDEWLTRSVIPYTYTDMRKQPWLVKWNGTRWLVYSTPESAAYYSAPEFDAKQSAGRMALASAGANAAETIDELESLIEGWRVAAREKAKGESWWLLAALVFLVVSDNKRRR